MSSINTTATTTTTPAIDNSNTRSVICWCHECDMSVSLISSSPPLLCPHCHGDFLEEMESPLFSNSNPNPNPNPNTNPYLRNRDHNPFPLLSSFPITSRQTLNSVSESDDEADTDEDSHQIPSTFHRATATTVPDNYLVDSPYFDRLIQHLANPEGDTARRHHYGSSPASKASIESIPTIKITTSFLSSDTVLCAVCKDEFVVDVEAKQLPCNHIYHFDCILPWLSQHNTCPVCRFRLPTDDTERRSYRRSRVPIRLGNFMEDEDMFGLGSTLRHFARRHRNSLVFPVRSAPVDSASSPTQMGQAETSSAGPANSGETVSSWPVEGGSHVGSSRGGLVGGSERMDEDGDTVMSDIREFLLD